MSIYRVALCDDDAVIIENICSLLEEILTEEEVPYEITTFPDAYNLNKILETQSNPFDLLILDIQMQEMSGMELAYSLRERGDRVSIIFITVCDDYLQDGYGVQPIHFLLKPIKKDALANALHTDLKLNHRPKTILIRIGTKMVSLDVSDICYIESSNHSITIHQKDGKQTYSMSLSEIERNLPPGQFCRCHNSYVVNLGYVKEIRRTVLYLRGGETLPVGRAYYKSFQEMLIRYLNQ